MQKSIGKEDTIIVPMPVLIIGTYDKNGEPNAMNVAWACQSDLDAITIFVSRHKTTENLMLKKEFTVAFATKDTVVASDYFGVESGHHINKIEKAGFHAVKAEHVDAPIITEYPVTLECKMTDFIDEGTAYRVIGKVVNVVAEESVLTNGKVDLGKMQAICYDSTSHAYRIIGEAVGQGSHDGLALKGK